MIGWAFLIALWGLGGYAFATRYTLGLGAVTNLTDAFPWGLWKAMVLCGIAFAAGGFLTACMAYMFRIRIFYPILRPIVLASYLCYTLSASGALIVDLGRYYKIWRPIVKLAASVGALRGVVVRDAVHVRVDRGVRADCSPKARMASPGAFRPRRSPFPSSSAAWFCPRVHQSSLGSLFLIVPKKLLPLWYTPLLPILFFISALISGFAMAIFVSALSFWIFHRPLDPRVLTALAKGMTPLLFLYLFLRIADLTARNAWVYIFGCPLQGLHVHAGDAAADAAVVRGAEDAVVGPAALGVCRRDPRHPGGHPEPAQRRLDRPVAGHRLELLPVVD